MEVLLDWMFVIVVALMLLASCAINFFHSARINWTFKERWRVLEEEGVAEFDRLPEADAIFSKFWVWDINEFKREGSNNV